MGQVIVYKFSQFPSNPLLVTLASFPHILTIVAKVSFLGNSGESVKINKGQLIAIMLCTQAGLLTPTSSTETNYGIHLTQHTCTSQPIRRYFHEKCFLPSSKKIVGLLSFTFTMSNYSYRLLSRCDKQLGNHLVLLHETILGLTRMATEHCLPTVKSLL